MKLSSRFALDVLVIVASAFTVVVSRTFETSAAGWVGFGVFTGLTVLAVIGALAARSIGQRVGHAVLGLAGLWSLIAALAFSGSAMTWLLLADAVGMGVLALADLTAHEVTTENVVHRLEIREPAESVSANGRIAA